MKFFVLGSLILALAGAVIANVSPIPPEYCAFQCSPAQRPACGNNGKCYRSFPGKCELDRYNCLNPHRSFKKVGERKCDDKTAVVCKKGDY